MPVQVLTKFRIVGVRWLSKWTVRNIRTSVRLLRSRPVLWLFLRCVIGYRMPSVVFFGSVWMMQTWLSLRRSIVRWQLLPNVIVSETVIWWIFLGHPLSGFITGWLIWRMANIVIWFRISVLFSRSWRTAINRQFRLSIRLHRNCMPRIRRKRSSSWPGLVLLLPTRQQPVGRN